MAFKATKRAKKPREENHTLWLVKINLCSLFASGKVPGSAQSNKCFLTGSFPTFCHPVLGILGVSEYKIRVVSCIPTMSLPSGFLNGFASSAFQIEGAAKDGGRGLSIWDTFCATPGRIADRSNADVACDSYHKWRKDIALLKEYGTNPSSTTEQFGLIACRSKDISILAVMVTDYTSWWST